MKTIYCLLILSIVLFAVIFDLPATAADERNTPKENALKDEKQAPNSQTDNASQTTLTPKEKAFQEMLSGVTLVGHFTIDGQESDAKLRAEKYTIHKVTKMSNDYWLFVARVQYGRKDVRVPLPLEVQWAGDTPVITLTDMKLPELGTYTARVLIYRGQYAGTWSGGDHGGHLFGKITKIPEKSSNDDASSEKPPKIDETDRR